MCEKKNEWKKKTKQEVGCATAQLGHDTMGNCFVTQQVLGVQVGWGRACHDTISVS